MLSSEGLSRLVIRPAAITRRFQKFLLVGAMASPIAIFLSMVVTFILNERWTWHDRGQGRILHRALLYGSINSGGLLINWLTLVSLHQIGLDYLIANLIGAGIAAVWNFSLNHALTWRR